MNFQYFVFDRAQHSFVALIVLVLAGVIAYLSWTQQPQDVFVFPRLVSVFFVVLAIWNAARAFLGLAKVGAGISKQQALNVVPGLIIMIALVFWGAKFLGFYFASTMAFVGIVTLYDPARLSSGKAWLVRTAVTIAFMGVIYLLFSFLLKVQMPRGLFF